MPGQQYHNVVEGLAGTKGWPQLGDVVFCWFFGCFWTVWVLFLGFWEVISIEGVFVALDLKVCFSN